MKFTIGLIFVIGIVILTMSLEKARSNKVNYLRVEGFAENGIYQQKWSGDTLIIEPFDSSLSSKDKYILLSPLNSEENVK